MVTWGAVSVIDILFTPGRLVHARQFSAAPVESLTLWYQQRSNQPCEAGPYSHSIVAGGFEEMS
jgi:hypothetical protein